MLLKLTLATAGITLLAAGLAAQTPSNLIGLTNNSRLVKQNATAVNCPSTACTTLIGSTNSNVAGGTACDADKDAVWITNGTELRLVDSNTCRDLCPAQPLPIASIATGLAVYEPGNTLFVVDARSRFYRFSTTCPIQGGFMCDVLNVHPVGHQVGGIAVDDVNGVLIWTSSSFNTPNPNNVLYVSKISSPCTVVCRIPIPNCGANPLRAIRGVGYDPCARTVWVTDGQQSAGIVMNTTNCAALGQVRCCPLTTVGAGGYIGLCVRPSQSRITGSSCLDPNCAPCPNMLHTTGWASIGGTLSFNLDNAPVPSRALLMLGFGPCQSPGVGLPILCGPIRITLFPTPPIFAGPFPVLGGSPCGGTLAVKVGVPLDPSLCGALLSSQYVTACANGGALGLGITNCVTTRISGS